MRLAEDVEQIRKRRRGDYAHDDGPAQKLLVPPAIAPAHARQKVVAMFFFALPGPKHKRSLVRLDCNSQTGRLWQTNIRGAGHRQDAFKKERGQPCPRGDRSKSWKTTRTRLSALLRRD